MKTVHTVPLEVLSSKSLGQFETEPQEVGWADEVLVFVYVREVHGTGARLNLRPEVSADGARWISFGDQCLTLDRVGATNLSLRHFGNWLRLVGDVAGDVPPGKAPFLVDIYYVLKG